jgi:Bacteriophage probable baseplate hub protein
MTESALTQLAVYTARPTVRVDGQENARVTELLAAMEVRERDGGMSALELRLSNLASDPFGSVDFAFEDDSVLALGAAVTVDAGDEGAQSEIFRGTITGLEAVFSENGAPELVVLAEDAFQRARMERRTAVHENATLAGLANDLAGRVALTAQVTGLTADIGTQVQLNESDLAFLRRLLARYDADMQAADGNLRVAPRGSSQRGTLTLELHGQLRRVRVLADLAHQVTSVSVTGWDPALGQRVSARSTGAQLGPGSGQTGAELLGNSLGARAHHLGHIAVTTSDEAQALADAAYDHAARRFVRVEGVAEGNPALHIGTEVTLSGMGPRFDNTYYVVGATHHYDLTRGYETLFEAECAYWLAG